MTDLFDINASILRITKQLTKIDVVDYASRLRLELEACKPYENTMHLKLALNVRQLSFSERLAELGSGVAIWFPTSEEIDERILIDPDIKCFTLLVKIRIGGYHTVDGDYHVKSSEMNDFILQRFVLEI